MTLYRLIMLLLYGLCLAWGIHNASVAYYCDGETSPAYWPPITTCTPRR